MWWWVRQRPFSSRAKTKKYSYRGYSERFKIVIIWCVEHQMGIMSREKIIVALMFRDPPGRQRRRQHLHSIDVVLIT